MSSCITVQREDFNAVWPIQQIDQRAHDRLDILIKKVRTADVVAGSDKQHIKLVGLNNDTLKGCFMSRHYKWTEDYNCSLATWGMLQQALDEETQENAELPHLLKEKVFLCIGNHADLMGADTQYISKIIKASLSPLQYRQAEGFLERFYKKFSQSLPLETPHPQRDQIIIGTSTAGGAHKTIAENAKKAFLEYGYAAEVVDETVLYDTEDDPLKACIGLSHSQCYNKVEQMLGDGSYSRKLKRLGKLLQHFISPKKNQLLLDKIRGARWFYSTSHHDYNIRLIANGVEKIVFQLCDYGVVPDKFNRILEIVIEFDLPNIYFLAPSDSTYFMFEGEKLNFKNPHASIYQQRFERVVRIFGYPINPICYSPSPPNEKQQVLSQLKATGYPLRDRAHLIVMVMGKQGVANILDKYVKELQHKAASALDVMVVCGNNESLKQQIESLPTSSSSGVNIIATSAIKNDLLVRIGRCFDVYVTKPGGATIAEGIYGTFSLLLHKNPSAPWEFGNIDEAKMRVNALEIEESQFYEQTQRKIAHRSELDSMEHGLPIPQMSALLNLFDLPELELDAA